MSLSADIRPTIVGRMFGREHCRWITTYHVHDVDATDKKVVIV
jgi:hypothetical protein